MHQGDPGRPEVHGGPAAGPGPHHGGGDQAQDRGHHRGDREAAEVRRGEDAARPRQVPQLLQRRHGRQHPRRRADHLGQPQVRRERHGRHQERGRHVREGLRQDPHALAVHAGEQVYRRRRGRGQGDY